MIMYMKVNAESYKLTRN